jgi:hypothetical protein
MGGQAYSEKIQLIERKYRYRREEPAQEQWFCSALLVAPRGRYKFFTCPSVPATTEKMAGGQAGRGWG